MKDGKKILWGYARTSTPKKEIGTKELIKQKTNIRSFVERNPQYELYKISEEAISGTKEERPVQQEILDNLDQVDGVIVDTMSRWGRNLKDTLDKMDVLTKEGKLFIVTSKHFIYDPEDIMSRMTAKFLSFIADMEREFIVERLQSGRRLAIERGEKMGRNFKEISPQLKIQIKKYYEQGLGLRPIALLISKSDAEYGERYSHTFVGEILKEMGVESRPSNNPNGRPVGSKNKQLVINHS